MRRSRFLYDVLFITSAWAVSESIFFGDWVGAVFVGAPFVYWTHWCGSRRLL